MKNKITTYCIVISLLLCQYIIAQPNLYFGSSKLIVELKEFNSDNVYLQKILAIADHYIDNDFNTITSVESPLGREYLHDYFSESPYWWPDVDNPNGSYIKRDGVRNPDRFTEHKELLGKMYQGLTSLAFAAYFTENKIYAQHAEEIISSWFINEKTKMAPHLIYAQIIRNKDVKRGVGIIETHSFVGLIEALNLLKQSNLVQNKIINGFDAWLTQYYKWLTESEWGLDEKERGNNHSSWWAAQATVIAIYLGYDEVLEDYFSYGKTFLIDRQITIECRQPLEEARTLSLSYSTFNLNALSFLATALQLKNYDLFNYNNKGCSILEAADYCSQYLDNPSAWKLKQIKPFSIQPQPYVALIALKQNKPKYTELYKKLLDNEQEKSIAPKLDPFLLLLNAQISICK